MKKLNILFLAVLFFSCSGSKESDSSSGVSYLSADNIELSNMDSFGVNTASSSADSNADVATQPKILGFQKDNVEPVEVSIKDKEGNKVTHIINVENIKKVNSNYLALTLKTPDQYKWNVECEKLPSRARLRNPNCVATLEKGIEEVFLADKQTGKMIAMSKRGLPEKMPKDFLNKPRFVMDANNNAYYVWENKFLKYPIAELTQEATGDQLDPEKHVLFIPQTVDSVVHFNIAPDGSIYYTDDKTRRLWHPTKGDQLLVTVTGIYDSDRNTVYYSTVRNQWVMYGKNDGYVYDITYDSQDKVVITKRANTPSDASIGVKGYAEIGESSILNMENENVQVVEREGTRRDEKTKFLILKRMEELQGHSVATGSIQPTTNDIRVVNVYSYANNQKYIFVSGKSNINYAHHTIRLYPGNGRTVTDIDDDVYNWDIKQIIPEGMYKITEMTVNDAGDLTFSGVRLSDNQAVTALYTFANQEADLTAGNAGQNIQILGQVTVENLISLE